MSKLNRVEPSLRTNHTIKPATTNKSDPIAKIAMGAINPHLNATKPSLSSKNCTAQSTKNGSLANRFSYKTVANIAKGVASAVLGTTQMKTKPLNGKRISLTNDLARLGAAFVNKFIKKAA